MAVPESESRMTMCDPCTTRLNTSRPSWSMPNGWAQLIPDSGMPAPICEKP